MSSSQQPMGGDGALPQRYFCHQCDRHVMLVPPPSITDDIFCPNCGGGFLEESPTPPPPSNPIPYFPLPPATFFGGPLPVIISSSSAGPSASPFSVATGGEGATGFDDFTEVFGSQPPDEFNPLNFLNNYINNLHAGGATIQFVFEPPGGVSGGDFRFPANLGDYFIGPGLEQLIQHLAENDPNRYGTPPAAKSAIEGLPDVNITEETLTSDSSQCAVCKDSFELNSEAKQMPCNHIYHKDCILPWLELHNSCPVCRYELPTDDLDYENRTTAIHSNSNSSENNGNRDDMSNNSIPQTPRTLERSFRISLPWPFRGFFPPEETTRDSGGANDGNNRIPSDDASNSHTNARDDAREEDLD